MAKKKNSYDRLKEKYQALQDEKNQVQADLYYILKKPDTPQATLAKTKWDFRFTMDETIWQGEYRPEGFQGIVPIVSEPYEGGEPNPDTDP